MTAVPGHRFVTSDGTALYVDAAGPRNARLTLVLVHAWTQDQTEWEPILPLLPPEVRVIRYDHRGHGASAPAKPGTATIARLADDLAELLRAWVPDGPVVLAGHSLGGMTIMELAEQYPDLVRARVAGVAFIATSCSNMDRLTLGLPGAAGRAAIRVDKALGRRLSRYRKEFVPIPAVLARSATRWIAFGKKVDRGDVRAMTAQFLRAHPSSLGGFRDSISRHDRRAALATLAGTPGVILVGDRDRITPVHHAKVLADELPGAEFVLFPGAGHELTYERRHGVAARLRSLLEAATSPAAGSRRRSRATPASR